MASLLHAKFYTVLIDPIRLCRYEIKVHFVASLICAPHDVDVGFMREDGLKREALSRSQ